MLPVLQVQVDALLEFDVSIISQLNFIASIYCPKTTKSGKSIRLGRYIRLCLSLVFVEAVMIWCIGYFKCLFIVNPSIQSMLISETCLSNTFCVTCVAGHLYLLVLANDSRKLIIHMLCGIFAFYIQLLLLGIVQKNLSTFSQ